MQARSVSLWDLLAGVLAMGVAIGVAELVTGAIEGYSLILAVGDYIIDHSPGDAAQFAIDLFGKNDKKALVTTVVLALFAIGLLAGVWGRRSFLLGAGVFVAMGLVGALAGIDTPVSSGTKSTITAVIAAAAGIGALYLLLRADVTGERGPTDAAGRRQFFRVSAGALGVAVASLFVGRWVFGPAVDVEGERSSVELPDPESPDEDLPDPEKAALTVAGISPLITPNAAFYKIDTALATPGVEVDSWRLRITGLVDNPYELTYQELLEMGLHEETVTLSCVSNSVGGDLVGNAVWLGVPLAEILDRAGIQADATQIVARSVDGFTTGFRTDVALDGRPAMVAVGMNGEVLPGDHGFPARMIVPGLYGYVSATKWLEEIELTRLEDFDAYWIPRGWAKFGPIKTQSRIDVPTRGFEPGLLTFAGVAWGGNRSISAVEVRIVEEQEGEAAFGSNWSNELTPEFGEWRPAELSDVLSQSAWRQWSVDWDAIPGSYRVEVRAIDGDGATQTHVLQGKRPDGATGYHGFNFTVREA